MKRYITDIEKNIQTEDTDVLIIGSGIAGVYTALCLNPDIKVTIIAKEEINISNSALAQGGIAVSLGEEDRPQLHLEDTMMAGAELCDEEMVWILVNEAKDNIMNLCGMGVNFDMHAGSLALTKEAAHSRRRIIHAGDFTGKEVCDRLIENAEKKPNIILKEKMFAIDILTNNDLCTGVLVMDQVTGVKTIYRCKAVVCASGGFGQVYENTTNPIVATGDGLAMAYRAGCSLMDMEFVQFHPTVLYHTIDKTFLISEAVRGEGAVLRNKYGKRFMPDYHHMNELAPRDIVARAIFSEMHKTNSDCVYLDITFKKREYLSNRFPKIFNTCLNYGIDMSKDYIPVAPAEHYCMGGIETDSKGRTGLFGFYACGEAACTRIHGANRLASNSLLEGVVFGKRIADDINENIKSIDYQDVSLPEFSKQTDFITKPVIEMERTMKKTMNEKVGIVRNGRGLTEAMKEIDQILTEFKSYKCSSMVQMQVLNMATLAKLVISSAIKREESRGAHYRSDFPEIKSSWKKNILNKKRDVSHEEFEFND